jgi:hypothetical protein
MGEYYRGQYHCTIVENRDSYYLRSFTREWN